MLAPASLTMAVMLRQRARHVARADADARQPAGPHHAALDDRRQQQRVDVAAAQHQADLAAAEALRVLQQRRQPGGARALDQGLLDLQQHHDGLLDVAFVDQHQVVDVLLDDLLGDAPGRAHGDALGDGAAALGQRLRA